jgi:ubiquinone biosynthesis UbiH/UbiF/VisC/COQ6 family hydroxylase
MSRRELYEVAIIGGGPVGLFAALQLAQREVKVAIFAGNEPALAGPDAEFDLRVYALAPDVLKALSALGVSASRAYSYGRMRVWADQKYTAALAFSAADYGWPELGQITEHAALCSGLWQALRKQNKAHIIAEVAMDHVSSQIAHGEAEIKVSSKSHTVRARWLLAADGASSATRTAAGIAHGPLAGTANDGACAVVASVQISGQHQATALQHFTGGNVIAMLPLAPGWVSLVYSTHAARAAQLMQFSDASFLTNLHTEFGDSLGEFVALAGRRQIPLQRGQAAGYQQGQVLLIGDSAHTVHPLAGQGLNMGMRDVICLANQVSQMQITHAGAQRYARERRSENEITARAIETIRGLFAPVSGPLALLRGPGMALINRAAPMKRLLAELATGQVAGWPQ